MYTCITNGLATHLVRSKGTIYHQVLLKLKYQLAWHLKIVSGKQNSFLFVCGAGVWLNWLYEAVRVRSHSDLFLSTVPGYYGELDVYVIS